jgi:hypothetical protein
VAVVAAKAEPHQGEAMKIVTGSCFHAASASEVMTFYGQGYITSLQEGHRRQIMIAHRGRFERFRRRRQASIKLRIKKSAGWEE